MQFTNFKQKFHYNYTVENLCISCRASTLLFNHIHSQIIFKSFLKEMSRSGDDSEADDEIELEWLLGFVDPPRHACDLLRHRFPSKVGGRPAWLDPVHLPSLDQLTCPDTGRIMQFLIQVSITPPTPHPHYFCFHHVYIRKKEKKNSADAIFFCSIFFLNYIVQVYAPIDENSNAFHRTIYIFTSPDGSSLSNPGAVKAFRCQLPRKNSFYPFDLPKIESKQPPPLPPAHLALSLERDPWKTEEFAVQIATAASTTKIEKTRHESASALFTESELLVEPEPEEDGPEINAQAQSLLEQYKIRAEKEGEYTEDELPGDVVNSFEDAVPEAQHHFAAFAAQIAKEPSQVVRYCFDEGASPLCPSATGIPASEQVPGCERCGGPRKFEFQVMPQLLNHLGVDAADPKAPDWGTIAVYSCAASCSGGGGGGEEEVEKTNSDNNINYFEEWVWVQPPS